MLKVFVFVFIFVNSFFVSAYAERNTRLPTFEKKIFSTDIKPECEYFEGDETGIFSITYKEKNITNIFLIMKGIDPHLCKWHEMQVKKIMSSKKILLIGRSGTEYSKTKEIAWTWVSVRSKKGCHSYFEADCP